MSASRSHRGWAIAVAVFVCLGFAALVGFTGCGADEEAPTTTAAASRTTAAGPVTTAAPASREEAPPSAATGDSGGSVGQSTGPLIGTSDQKVIADAVLDIEVERGGFQAAFTNAALLSDRYGGYIVASNSYASGDDEAVNGGTIAIRIPAASFSAAVADAGKLGTLKNQQIMTQDVTEEYVDLQARIINSEAKVQVYRRLYDQAATINDIVQVQEVLSSALDELEQLRGRLRFLEEHTSYSTLTMNIYEAGVETVVVEEEEDEGWGVVEALKDGLHYLVKVFNGIIRGLGVLIPILIVLAIIAYIVYRVWRVVARRNREREHARYQQYPQGWSGPQAQGAMTQAPPAGQAPQAGVPTQQAGAGPAAQPESRPSTQPRASADEEAPKS